MRRKDEEVWLENSYLKIGLSTSNGAIVSVYNKRRDLELICANGVKIDKNPWRLKIGKKNFEEVKDKKNFVSFQCQPDSSWKKGKSIDLYWEVEKGIVLRGRIELPTNEENAYFYIQVGNETDVMIIELEYPILYGIGELSEDAKENFLAHPVASGYLFRDPFHLFHGNGDLKNKQENRGLYKLSYPDATRGTPMQFMIYYAQEKGGFYLACHDPLDTAKYVDFYKYENNLSLTASFTHRNWDIYQGNQLVLEYPIVIGALMEGNWYEGAERYREWSTSMGKGHPEWCKEGRIEDRLKEEKASRWLLEEVGFCTFGISSSWDVSKWLETFHHITGKPVFHILGFDWPNWASPSPQVMEKLEHFYKSLGLGDFASCSASLFITLTNISRYETEESLLEKFARGLGIKIKKDSYGQLKGLYKELTKVGPWLKADTEELSWFPTKFHPNNLKTIKKNGDYFASFEFDFFDYGHNLEKFGLLSKEGYHRLLNKGEFLGEVFSPSDIADSMLCYWMDPGTEYWQNFHTERDAKVIKESGASALYYDISSCIGVMGSDRLDHNHPLGWGRWMVGNYKKVFLRTKQAAIKANRDIYIPLGTEGMTENFIEILDFGQWRAGGLVQGGMEANPFIPLLKDNKVEKIPLFTYVYHEYGPIKLDGWAKLSSEFGDIFYLIAAQIALEGNLLELNYEFSSLELFSGMKGSTYQLVYLNAIYEDKHPYLAYKEKLEFIREITDARTNFDKDYLVYGKATRPLKMIDDIPNVTLDWFHYNDIGGHRTTEGKIIKRIERGQYTTPGVIQRGWSYKNKKLGFLFVNLEANSLRKIRIQLDLSKYELLDQNYRINFVSSAQKKQIAVLSRTDTKQLEL
jgi:hypothetical protein